jgi:hypothetical protein
MAEQSKQYKFFVADTGEVLDTIESNEEISDQKLNEIRQKLALEAGIEANSIEYKEEPNI